MRKLLLFLFLIPLAVSANNVNSKGKHTKTKKINKEFRVNADATLEVSNKYGNIDITTWDQSRIVMEISISTNGNDEEKVQKRLDQINVEFSDSAGRVKAKTIIEKSSKSWSIWGKKNNVSMKINYIIKMPVSNNVALSNDYGNIMLDKLNGNASLDVDYGDLRIGELNGSENNINMDYSGKSSVDAAANVSVNVDYSTLHIGQSNNVNLNADYSHLSFGEVATLNYNCDYGSLKAEGVGSITGDSDYMHTTIGNLANAGTFKADYGSIKIGSIGAGFSKLSSHTSYTHVKIGVSSGASFAFEADLSYSGFKYGDGFNITKEIKNNTKKQYAGTYNGSNGTVTIKASYGSVHFTNK